MHRLKPFGRCSVFGRFNYFSHLFVRLCIVCQWVSIYLFTFFCFFTYNNCYYNSLTMRMDIAHTTITIIICILSKIPFNSQNKINSCVYFCYRNAKFLLYVTTACYTHRIAYGLYWSVFSITTDISICG